MAFIGNTVQTQGFTPAVDYFSGNGSTVTFTLSRPVAAAVQVEAVIDNVVQNPSTAYTVSGNAITFTSAPLSGSNNIYVRYTSLITTYNGISQSPSVIGDLTASGGYLSTGSFNNSFVDGTIVDYVTGNGRITVGSADGFTLYTGGTSGRTALASWTSAGVMTNTGDAVVNGLTVGKGGGSQSGNTVLGVGALASNSTANGTVAIGYQALNAMTTGDNCAVGYQAMLVNTTGATNTVFGTYTLKSNTTGSSNVAMGRDALQANTTASNNTAVGYQAGYAQTTGGSYAGYSTYLGHTAGLAATGAANTLIGQQAGSTITSGEKNTLIGRYNGNQNGLDIRTASGYIVLSDGDGNPRQVIDSSGNVMFGVTSTAHTSAGFTIEAGGQVPYVTRGVSGTFMGFYNTTNATLIGYISNNGGTATAYNTTSDYRLKENIAPMTGALDKVARLKPVTYKWKSDGSAGEGFIAHELQEVIAGCVTGEKDAVDAEGNPVYQGIDTSFLVATLTAAIQEQQAMIEELKAEVDALKAGK